VANLASVEIVYDDKHPECFWVCSVTSAHYENLIGCWWQVFDQNGRSVSWERSLGWNKDGSGSALTAMAAAKKAARYRIRKAQASFDKQQAEWESEAP
jgi:hypothetical protein